MLSFGMPGQPRQHGAVGEDRLEAADLAAHRSVAEDVHPAGVRRDHAADRGRVARAEVHADLPARAASRRLRRGQRHAGADGHLAGVRVHPLDVVEPPQAEHHLAAARHRSADEPGVAALGHDPDAGIGADAEDRRDLVGRAGPDHRQGSPRPAAGPIGLVRGTQVGIGQAMVGADDLGELRGQAHGADASGPARLRRSATVSRERAGNWSQIQAVRSCFQPLRRRVR